MPSRVYEVPLGRSDALARFDVLILDVENIIERHVKAGGGVGRPATDESPLSRAAIVMLYAAWEYYVEESLIETVHRLTELEPDQLPEALRDYTKRHTSGDPWALAGDKWRPFVRQLVEVKIRGPEGFNDAHYKKVTGLQRSILGVSPLEDVRWMNQSPEQVGARVDAVVDLRGEIAHTGQTAEGFWHGDTRYMKDFVVKAAHEADYRMRLWLYDQIPTLELWPPVRAALADGGWRTSEELRVACGFPARVTGRNYRMVNGYLTRCVELGALERQSNNLYRLPTATAA